jgi:hypothetical protein
LLSEYNLDDEKFEQIAERARLSAPEHFQQWSDLNTHDPGVTLIELFAWLTELQRFHLASGVTAKPFFPLLGIQPKEAAAALADVSFPDGYPPQYIPAGTKTFAEDICFETTRDIAYKGESLTVTLVQKDTVKQPFSLGVAKGLPNECFFIDASGLIILRESLRLTIDNTPWTVVDYLYGSGFDDNHFTLDAQSGEINFGDGINGALPLGEVLITEISYTRGPNGNIAAERLTTLAGMRIVQPLPASNGVFAECIEDALTRSRSEHRQAVTSEDIEQLVLETPGLEVSRAKAFASNALPNPAQPRVINIAVSLAYKTLSEEEKQLISQHLEPYRLACHVFHINDPEIVKLGLSIELRVRVHSNDFAQTFEQSLRRFISETFGGFGVTVSPAEIRAFILDTPEVAAITHCSLRAYGQTKSTHSGDIIIAPGALADLVDLNLRLIHESDTLFYS